MNKSTAENTLKKLKNDIGRQKDHNVQIKMLAEMLNTLAAYIFSTSK